MTPAAATHRLRTVAVAFCAASLGALLLAWCSSLAIYGRYDALDMIVLISVRRAILAHPADIFILRALATGTTFFGAFPTLSVVALCAAGLLAWSGDGRRAIALVAGDGLGMGLANLLKRCVDRPRPTLVDHWATFGSSSFPSGHSADSAIAYLLLGMIAAARARSPAVQQLVVALALAPPLLIGASRVILGVHWPSDVLGGWAFGGAWAASWSCIPVTSAPGPSEQPATT